LSNQYFDCIRTANVVSNVVVGGDITPVRLHLKLWHRGREDQALYIQAFRRYNLCDSYSGDDERERYPDSFYGKLVRIMNYLEKVGESRGALIIVCEDELHVAEFMREVVSRNIIPGKVSLYVTCDLRCYDKLDASETFIMPSLTEEPRIFPIMGETKLQYRARMERIQAYHPKILKLNYSDMSKSEQLCIDKIAEALHDEWAALRLQDGWTYGEMRNEELRTNPCLVPYEDLPEREKIYDRRSALLAMMQMNALRQ